MKLLKRILLGLAILLVISTIGVLIWAQRGIVQIYGGYTEVVDPSQFEEPITTTAIANTNVLAPDASPFIPNQTVLLENGTIISIDSVPPPASVTTIDGSGKFLIPGLTDAHVHLFKSPNDLLLYVANGITQIRELIGEEDHLKWKREIESGRVGPAMWVASPRLGSFEPMEGWFMEWSQGYNNINTAQETRVLLEQYAQQGYDGVKIYRFLNKECSESVSELAPELGLEVWGHIPWSIELTDVWNSNQSDIAHLEEVMNALRREFGSTSSEVADAFLAYVDQRSAEIADTLIKNDISVTTTLWLVESFVRQKFELERVLTEIELAYENPGISEWMPYGPPGLGWLPTVNRYRFTEELSAEELAGRRIFWDTYAGACQLILRNFAARGVTILAGTDANLPPTVPGFSLHDELLSMERAGMTPSASLQSATSIPAKRLGANTGRILPGKEADLVLLNQNPLESIAHTKSIHTVILDGRVFDRTQLDSMLAKVKAANDASRTKSIAAFQ